MRGMAAYILLIIVINQIALHFGLTTGIIDFEPREPETAGIFGNIWDTLGNITEFVIDGFASYFQFMFMQINAPALVAFPMAALSWGSLYVMFRLVRGGG